jgi:hypothetical protein
MDMLRLTKGKDKINANNQSMIAGPTRSLSVDALLRLYQRCKGVLHEINKASRIWKLKIAIANSEQIKLTLS